MRAIEDRAISHFYPQSANFGVFRCYLLVGLAVSVGGPAFHIPCFGHDISLFFVLFPKSSFWLLACTCVCAFCFGVLWLCRFSTVVSRATTPTNAYRSSVSWRG